MTDVYNKLLAAESQTAEGNLVSADESLKKVREKYMAP